MDILSSRVNENLVNTSYAFKTLIDNTLTAFSSDGPVEDFNPLLGIYSSCTRANLKYNKFLNIDQKTSIKEAIDAYTINPAYLTFEEGKKGLVKEGYYSDLVVLSEDLFNIDEKKIKDVEVIMTIVGGRIIYEKRKK